MDEASYVIGINIHRDRVCLRKPLLIKFLRDSWWKIVHLVLRLLWEMTSLIWTSVLNNNLEGEQMENIPHASAVGTLMYAQVCIGLDIAYGVGMLGRYQSNPRLYYWKAAKKVMRYLQGTKSYMLTYRRSDDLEVVRYSDLDYAGCLNCWRSTSG